MNKLLLFGAVALVVGIAGGTGAGVMLRPPAPAAADSTAAEPAASAHGDHAAAPHDAPAAVAPPAAAGTPGEAAAAHAPAVADARTGSEPAAAPAAAPAPSGRTAVPAAAVEAPIEPSYASVSRILVNMKPAEAAKILGYLPDLHVEGILREVGPRQAAVLLGQLPSERAARLSRRLIEHPDPEAVK